jgi:tetratricopeptide (TPR) repeat protein
MEEALPLGNVTDIHYYGRSLLNLKQAEEAFKVFKLNYDKHPNVFTTNVGMGRGYAAIGDYRKALTFMKAALSQAPDNLNKNSVEGMIRRLEQQQDVN